MFDTLHLSGFGRQRIMRSFERLDAGFLVATHDMYPLCFETGRFVIHSAEFLHSLLKLFGGLQLVF